MIRLERGERVSDEDRERWNERYRTGRRGGREWPSVLLQQWLDARDDGQLPPNPRALDLACGTGRNTIALARAGFAATGVDIAAAGLKRAGARATAANVAVDWLLADLDEPLPPMRPWDLIVVFRYFNPALLQSLPARLAAGGTLIVETHLTVGEAELAQIAGPSSNRFRAEPGAVASAVFEGAQRDGVALALVHQQDGRFVDPDGAPVALSRLIVARR